MIGRISLPRTTTVSLNERFSTLRQLRERQQEEARQLQELQQRQASQQLVDQMESRPSVRAALGGHRQTLTPVLPEPSVTQSPKPRLHVKQRLAIQARLGVMRTVPGQGGGGPISTRLGRGANVKRLQTARKAVTPQRGVTSNRGRGRGGRTSNFTGTRTRGGATAGRGRGRGQGTTNTRGAGRARGRGRGARGRAAGTPATKEALDAELDSYMSGTRGHLDAELDEYMKEAACRVTAT
ncbi:chromatin target of PRMT1 protein-like [Amphibalanus amphitrite]|uniref:chromatin target of PRMT1 protein-like n=1 Tax=Amphibalanus amphitrite TaxID=1232801 RepID=UPI001C916D1C|nr:chromatin target of PRMT1 protein-like [Amphibalanus amphitrite]